MTPLLLALLLAGFLHGKAEAALSQVKGAVHVHTSFSTGSLSLEEVIQEARRAGIGALILADNFLLRFEYGLPPFRGLVKKVVEKPSVFRLGNGRWLQAIEAAQLKFPDVVLIPGVEVIPYYYWTGSPFKEDLTLWDAQKNLLVVGLSRPQDYEGIPAIGHLRAPLATTTNLLKLSLAAVAIGGGLLLLRARRERKLRLTHFSLKVPRRYRLPGWAALGLGVLLLLEALMAPEADPYRGKLGIGPYQRVIEYGETRGGAVLWSFPEARDFRRIEVGGFGKVSVRTEPYPEALLQSHGYTGFGGLYPDTVTFTEPGREWDRLLSEYSDGRRERPAWAVGELGYHGPPKRLSEALTIFLVSEQSRKAIVEALKAGRMYAVSPLKDHHLVLEDFSMSQGKGSIPMGGELAANGQGPLVISLRVSASDGREMPFALRLIRSGRVLNVLEGRTPFETLLNTEPPEVGRRDFFRLEITTPPRLLSNPIFVRRG